MRSKYLGISEEQAKKDIDEIHKDNLEKQVEMDDALGLNEGEENGDNTPKVSEDITK